MMFKKRKRTSAKQGKEFIRTFYQNNKLCYSIALVAVIGQAILEIVLAYLLQEIMDIAVTGGRKELVDMLIVTALYIVSLVIILLIVRQGKSSFMKKAMKQYRGFVFEKITKKSIGSFSEESTSKYISALTNDAITIEQNYLYSSFLLVSRIVWFVAGLGMMFWYNWTMTLVVIGLCLIPMLVSILFGGKLVKEDKIISENNETFVGMIKDLLTGFTVIKSFKAEKEVVKLFDNHNSSLENSKYRRRRVEEFISIVTATSGFVVQMGVFFYGTLLAIRGEITVGVVVAFVQLMNYVLIPLNDVPKCIANRKAAVGLIDKVAEAVAVNISREGRNIPHKLEDCIKVEQLNFGYNNDELILHDINVSFESGKSYAIVGGSGSGKTTLLNLLLGSFTDYEGMVTFDGEELRNISTDSLYDIISIIQQNVFVFDNSIRDNITMFKEFEEDTIQFAIERAGLTNLIEEKGHEYNCGENGCGLSGGERQRISIARCLLRNTPVLMMDEATAALDAATAFSVTNAILDIKNLTRIIVTHRLEEHLLRKYDEIIVMKNGYLTEKGTFEELINQKGYFFSLYMVTNSLVNE